MNSNDHDGNDQRKSRGDPNKPTRDARGRWLKDYCPNPKGRPKKKPKVYIDQADIRIFGSTMIDVTANGQKETMDRRAALLNKMFETAMKGKVSMQRFLYLELEKNAKQLAAARVHYDQLMLDWFVNNPDLRKPDYEIPIEVEVEMLSLRSLLNHYFPSDYPLDGMSANNDGDNG